MFSRRSREDGDENAGIPPWDCGIEIPLEGDTSASSRFQAVTTCPEAAFYVVKNLISLKPRSFYTWLLSDLLAKAEFTLPSIM